MTLYQIHSRTITVGELLERLGDPDLTVVDVRSTDAYNGWRLGSVRGGHIPGADAFPTTWLTTEDDAEIRRKFAAKGIAPGIGIDRGIQVPVDTVVRRHRVDRSSTPRPMKLFHGV